MLYLELGLNSPNTYTTDLTGYTTQAFAVCKNNAVLTSQQHIASTSNMIFHKVKSLLLQRELFCHGMGICPVAHSFLRQEKAAEIPHFGRLYPLLRQNKVFIRI
jgi:hypothetical protein